MADFRYTQFMPVAFEATVTNVVETRATSTGADGTPVEISTDGLIGLAVQDLNVERYLSRIFFELQKINAHLALITDEEHPGELNEFDEGVD